MDLLWISLIIGLCLGGIFSYFFGVYSKSTSDAYSRSFLGVSSSTVIIDGLILVVAAGFLFLSVVSIIIRDMWYPVNKPGYFTLEVLLMGFLPALVFLLMAPLRGHPITWIVFLEFMALVIKFGALHVVLQFSGFYSMIFPPLR